MRFTQKYWAWRNILNRSILVITARSQTLGEITVSSESVGLRLEYRKIGTQNWILATNDLVSPYTITGLEPSEYEIRAYDLEKDMYSNTISVFALGEGSQNGFNYTLPITLS